MTKFDNDYPSHTFDGKEVNEDEINFEEDLSIDQYGLDYEWMRQAKLMQKYAVLHADLSAEKEEAKEWLQRVDAEIDLDVRSNYESYGFETKPTEGAIKSIIANDKKHLKAQKELIEISRQVLIVQGAKTSMEHKKAALERLSSLYLSGYWADPRITKEAKDHYEDDMQFAHRQHLANNERIRKNG